VYDALFYFLAGAAVMIPPTLLFLADLVHRDHLASALELLAQADDALIRATSMDREAARERRNAVLVHLQKVDHERDIRSWLRA
jgi:hypothetical protein